MARAAAVAPPSYLSGFCNPSNDEASHRRCPEVCDGRACTCFCHWEPPVTLATPTGRLVTEADPETDEWFAARRAGITGTDLPKILGLTKYGNALSVWLDKRDELDDEAGEAAEWGHILEDPVAQEWARRNNTDVTRVGVLAHHEATWQRASLDRIVIDCPDDPDTRLCCGLEIKTRSAFKADEWRDGMPDSVLAQVAWGRIVSGLDHMHVAALIGGQRLVSYRYDRDDVLEDYLAQAALPVWSAVEEGTPPEAHPDSEGVLLDLLDRLYANREGARELDPEKAQPWLDQYAEGSDLERRAKALKTEAKTGLVQLLDDGDTGLLDDVPVFTYKRPAPGFAMPANEVRRLRTSDADLFQQLVDDGYITPTTPGPRFDLKTPKKETAA